MPIVKTLRGLLHISGGVVIPRYGAPATLYGSPIGGGSGYPPISQSDARYVVGAYNDLKLALSSALSGQMVYIADGAAITFDAVNQHSNSGGGYRGCYVKAGVILAGGRGKSGITPGTLKWDPNYICPNTEILVYCESNAKVIGLNLFGANETTSEIAGKKGYGIYCGSRVEVVNNEIHGCTHGGVGVFDSIDVWVHHNYFHDNIQGGMGYGVVVYPNTNYTISSVIVEGNRFKNHRHAVCGSEPRACWIVRYNYVDGLSTSSIFDQHGSDDHNGDPTHAAGGNIQIYNNTSVETSAHFVNIRGEPYPGDFISVHNNWSYNTGSGAIIQQFIHTPGLMYNAYDGLGGHTGGPFRGMESYDNWWGSTTPPN